VTTRRAVIETAGGRSPNAPRIVVVMVAGRLSKGSGGLPGCP
jgi:hypothetical protein